MDPTHDLTPYDIGLEQTLVNYGQAIMKLHTDMGNLIKLTEALTENAAKQRDLTQQIVEDLAGLTTLVTGHAFKPERHLEPVPDPAED